MNGVEKYPDPRELDIAPVIVPFAVTNRVTGEGLGTSQIGINPRDELSLGAAKHLVRTEAVSSLGLGEVPEVDAGLAALITEISKQALADEVAPVDTDEKAESPIGEVPTLNVAEEIPDTEEGISTLLDPALVQLEFLPEPETGAETFEPRPPESSPQVEVSPDPEIGYILSVDGEAEASVADVGQPPEAVQDDEETTAQLETTDVARTEKYDPTKLLYIGKRAFSGEVDSQPDAPEEYTQRLAA